MKKTVWLTVLLLLLPLSLCAEAPERKLTLMVYMCGSNLESEYGSASADLQEMLEAGPDPNISLLVMAGGSDVSGGTGYFQTESAGIHEIRDHRTRRIWQSESPMNMGDRETLTWFLRYGQENRPAEHYALILWNHGGGPLEGVCWDELFSLDNLTLSELTEGISRAEFGQKLSWIGFDACLMSSVEVASALVPYAEFMIASQETEPASGWNYAFLSNIGQDADGADVGRRVIESYFTSLAGSQDILTMACTDLSRIPEVTERMDEYFLSVSDRMTSAVFRELSGLQKDTVSFGKAVRGISDSSYDLMDLEDLISRYGEKDSPLIQALKDAVVYSLSNETGANGLSVYHPYSNKKKYTEKWRDGYKSLNFCSGYTAYQDRFGLLLTGKSMADWRGLRISEQWNDEQNAQHFSLVLTGEQQDEFSSAQLMIMENQKSFSENSYSPVSVENAVLREDGTISASYNGSCLCVTDAEGQILAGPVSYMLSEDGETYSILTRYFDLSGRPDGRDITPILYECVREEGSDRLRIERTYTYDKVSGTFTNRISFSEENFTDVYFYLQLRDLPEDQDPMPGFDEWKEFEGFLARTIPVPPDWHFQLFDQLKLSNLYAVFQITDLQQNTYSSVPERIRTPWENDIGVVQESVETEWGRFYLSGLLKDTEDYPGIELVLTIENNTKEETDYYAQSLILNGERTVYIPFSSNSLQPGESEACYLTMENTDLRGLREINRIDFVMNCFQNNYEHYSFTAGFDLENGDVSGIAPAIPEALDEGEITGMHWQLLSFEQEVNGDFIGLLHIRNESDEYITKFISPMVNRVRTDSITRIYLEPHTDGFFSFRMENRILLDRVMFEISGDARTSYMSIGQAAERRGLPTVEETGFIVENYGILDDAPPESISFRLPEPLPLAETDLPLPTSLSLLEGDVSVRLEGAYTGDEGVALAMEMSNDTDEMISLKITQLQMNGSENTDFGSITAETTLLPAHSKAILILKVVNDMFADQPAVPVGGRLETVSMAFEFPGSPPGSSVITFPDETFLGIEGGEYYPPEMLKTDPV